MSRILLICLIFPLAAVYADTIKLKTGEVLQGRVTASSADSVTFEVQFSPTIVEQQIYARADIANLAVEADDEIAYAKIRDIRTPETALNPKVCQALLDNDLAPFLKQFPASARVVDVQQQVKSIQDDLLRLKRGDVKVFGTWYDHAAFDAEKYQIEAATVLEEMKQEIAAKNFPSAMNSFDLLLRSYQNSAAYVEALPLARKAIVSLEQQLNFEIGNLPDTKAQRQANLDRTPVEDRPPIQRAIDAENARAVATALLAQKNNQRFFTIFPFDEQGLQAMQAAVQQIETQLKDVDAKKLAEGARLVRQANEELATHQISEAETTIAQLKATWQEYEGLARMEQRLQAEKTANADSAARANTPALPQ